MLRTNTLLCLEGVLQMLILRKKREWIQESMLLKWDENFMSLCFQVVILIRFVIYMCVNYIY